MILNIQKKEYIYSRDEDPTFFSTAEEKNPDPTPDPTLNRKEEKNIFIF